jgi:hypothetical protein
VRLPGFLIEEEKGFGDVIKKVTYVMDNHPCALAAKNGQPRINRWMQFHAITAGPS